jgi:hypothetical protein
MTKATIHVKPLLMGVLIALLLLCIILNRRYVLELFTPIVPDLSGMTPLTKTSTPLIGEVPELNGCWRKILGYMQTNPEKSMPIINFMKTQFFNSQCGIRQPRIEFEKLSDQYQPIFT